MSGLSRCESARSVPLDWHNYQATDRTQVVAAEIDQCYVGLTPIEKVMRQVELRERLVDAASGTLTRGSKLKKVRSQPDLWEIRWKFDGVPWRMYHAEPPSEPNLLLALKFHRKVVSGTQFSIRRKQNRQMSEAAERYKSGQGYRWGID